MDNDLILKIIQEFTPVTKRDRKIYTVWKASRNKSYINYICEQYIIGNAPTKVQWDLINQYYNRLKEE